MTTLELVGLAALLAALALGLIVLLSTMAAARRASHRNHNPLRKRGLDSADEGPDPWEEAGRRYGDEDGAS